MKRVRLDAKTKAAIRMPHSVKESVQDQTSWQTASAPGPRHRPVHDGNGIFHRALQEGRPRREALEKGRKRARAHLRRPPDAGRNPPGNGHDGETP